MAKKTGAPKGIPKPEIVQDFDLTKLSEHPDNPRELSRDGEAKLSGALDRFGMLDAIVVNRRADGSHVILGGHQRWKVLLKKGTTKGLVTITQVDAIKEKELLLLLNGHHGQWDQDKLMDVLEDLNKNGVALSDLGLDGQPQVEQIIAAGTTESVDDLAEDKEPAKDLAAESPLKAHTCPECGCHFDESGKVLESGEGDDEDEDPDDE